MSGTCQRHALQRTDISWWATRLIMTAILIRARSVVQVHPGPPLFSMAYRVLLQKPQPTIQLTRYCTVLVLTPSAVRYSPCAARVSSLSPCVFLCVDLVCLIVFIVLIKLLPILGSISGNTVKLMVF